MYSFVDKLKVQPLRIPEGWVVTKNDLFEVNSDLVTDNPRSGNKVDLYFFEDEMFAAKYLRTGALVELGWKPAYNESGRYVIQLIYPEEMPVSWSWPLGDVPYDWDNATVCFESRNRQETIDKLEEVFMQLIRDSHTS